MIRTYKTSDGGMPRTGAIGPRFRWAATAALIVATPLAIQGCGKSAAAETPRIPVVATIVTEDVATVERGEITNGPVITGTLTARRHATVRAEVGGVVLTALVDRGMTVTAGTPMLRIEDRALRDAEAAARSNVKTDEDALALAERRLTRSEKLVAGGAIAAEEAEDSRQALTSAESRLAASRAQLSAAIDALGRTVVRAPFAGVVSARPVNTGDVVQSGDVLFEVIDPTTMYVEGTVPSAQLGMVRVGSPVTLTVTGYQNRMFAGRVERVNPAADPTTRQVPIFITIQNTDGQLVAGLFAEGRVAPTTGPALLVPGAAVDRSGDSPTVVRLVGGHIERRPVQTGRQDRDGSIIEVRSGLTLGDTVLLGVARSLPTGTAARVAGGKTAGTPTAR